jgi:hypothetical protein
MDSNIAEGIIYSQPQTISERTRVAETCAMGLKLSIPILVDSLDHEVETAFNGWPERLYMLDTAGRVVYQGGKGPYGFDPDEFDRFLDAWAEKL